MSVEPVSVEPVSVEPVSVEPVSVEPVSVEPILQVEDIHSYIGNQWVHRGVDFSIGRGEVVALIGGSGTGKSVLLRQCIGLSRPNQGRVKLFGHDISDLSCHNLSEVRSRYGVLFQEGALFSSLSVAENVAAPLIEHTQLPVKLRNELVAMKIQLVGLPAEAANKLPRALSGGMKKRAALARALALEPELLFLDEPTSGLDPISAREFDHLLRVLCDSLGLTALMATHDLDTLWDMVDRVIVLHAGTVIADGPVREVAHIDHAWIRAYFSAHSARR